MANFDNNPSTQCKCDDEMMCGPCIVELERSMRRLRAQAVPDSDSLTDVTEWALSRRMELPSERVLRERSVMRLLKSGQPISSRGVRVPVYIKQGK